VQTAIWARAGVVYDSDNDRLFMATGNGDYDGNTGGHEWGDSVFALHPDASLMTGAPFLFQAHAFTAWLLLAIWPFTRLVHAWSIPIAYLGRAPILYRSRAAARRSDKPGQPSAPGTAAATSSSVFPETATDRPTR